MVDGIYLTKFELEEDATRLAMEGIMVCWQPLGGEVVEDQIGCQQVNVIKHPIVDTLDRNQRAHVVYDYEHADLYILFSWYATQHESEDSHWISGEAMMRGQILLL